MIVIIIFTIFSYWIYANNKNFKLLQLQIKTLHTLFFFYHLMKLSAIISIYAFVKRHII